MPSKKYTLGALLLLATVGLAQNQVHIVKSGDTLGHLSARYGISTKQIASANGLKESSTLALGRKIRIPKMGSASKPQSKSSGLVVRKGDTDTKLAKRIGISVEILRKANPNIKWTRLQIGQSLNVPGTKRTPAVKLASSPKSVKSVVSGTYVVRDGDNDWLIAKKFSVTPKQLRALNGGKDLGRIKAGQTLRVPGSSSAPVAASGIKSRYAFANGNGINIRTQPNIEAEKVAELAKGSRLAIIDRDGHWYRVRTENYKRGWVRGDLLKEAAQVAPSVVAAKVAPKKAAPTSKASRIARASKSNPVIVSGRPALLDHALAMRGTRYVWGGTSRSGVDCSGFTTNVFRSQGISLPRTSRDQSHYGTPVSKSELRPGDLVFFKTGRKSYINHVGIYAGDGKFVHSSSTQGGVRIDRLDSGYYSRQLVTARRVSNNLKGMKVTAAAAKKSEPVMKKEEVAAEEKLVPVTPTEPTVKPGTDAIIK